MQKKREKKEKRDKTKSFLIYLSILLGFALFAYIVLAVAYIPTLVSPLSDFNYTKIMNVSCYANETVDTINASIYYNASGGTATTLLIIIRNDSTNDTVFENVSTYIGNLTDGRNYNFSCATINATETILNATTSIFNITLDSTAPVVTIISPIAGGNYTGNITLNVSATDATTNVSSVYFNVTNTSANVARYYNATINATWALVTIDNFLAYYNATLANVSAATSLGDGNYSFVVYANDTLNNNVSTTAINFTIDRTPPNSSIIGAPVAGWNVSGTFLINATVEDALTAIASVKFGISNASANELFNVSATKTSGNIWGTTIYTNITDLPDGKYNISAYTYDHAGNLNSTNKIQITIDNTLPLVSYSCSPATSTQGNAVACTCTASDATSGVNTSAYIYTASPPTTDTGSHTLTCYATDYSNNTGTITTTYNVELGGGGAGSGSGGGGSSTIVATTIAILTEEQLTTGETKEISTNQQVKFSITTSAGASESHSVAVASVTATTAVIKLSSTPQEKTLSIGEEWKAELTEDNFYDVYVKLNSITNNKANVTIKSIHEEMPAETASETTPAEGEETTAEEAKSIFTKPLFWIAVVVIIFIIIYFTYRKKR